MSEEVVFLVESGFGAETKRPFVSVSIGSERVQMSPEDARRLALNLLASAEAAIADGFLVDFFHVRAGIGELAAARVLADFREWRQGHDRLPGHEPNDG